MAKMLKKGPAGAEEVPFSRSDYGTGRLITADTIFGSLVANEARGRLAHRLWGVPKDKSALVTAIAIGAFAGAIVKRIRAMVKVVFKPTFGEAAMSAAVLRESVYTVAGPKAKQEHFFGTLVALALLGGMAAPAVRGSAQQVKALMGDLKGLMGSRYRPGR
jgi:hypothetical protein